MSSTSGLRIAGQESRLVDIHFSSALSPMRPYKQLYGNSNSIKSWINAIGQTDASIFNMEDSDDANVFEFVTHPFGTCHPHSPFSDKFGSEYIVSSCFDPSAWAPDVLTSSYHDDSDECLSESSLSDDAQYVTIPFDSPWYRRPAQSPGPVTAYELSTAVYTSSCSSDVRQAIAQQEVLLRVFYEELQRVVPRDDDSTYDPDWLGDMDVDLVLAPLETYAGLCWESAVCEKYPDPPLERPIPDVPVGFDEV